MPSMPSMPAMGYRWLALLPLLFAAVFAAIASALAGTEALGPFAYWQRILVRVVAVAGCFAAMSAFQRGDHLRRAWLCLGAGTVAILMRDLLRLLPDFQPATVAPGPQVILSALGILANLALLAGVWLLAHSWRMAAIALPGGRSGVIAVGVVAAAVAIAVAGPAALDAARRLVGGDWSSLVLLVSAVVDILSLSLIAPLLLTALALRGSLFSWPWALLTASQIAWVLYDGAAALSAGPGGFPLPDLFRGLAENFLGVAGLTQLLAVRQVRRAAVGPAAGVAGPAGEQVVEA